MEISIKKSRSNSTLSLIELSPVLTAYFLGFFIFRGLFTNFPLYLQITRGLSDQTTVEIWAIISGTALFIGALTRLPAGLISDRIGRFKAFILGYMVYLGSLTMIYFVKSTLLYIIAISAVRFGLNTLAMTGRAVVSVSHRDRGFKNGLLSSMNGFGSFVGPVALSYTLEHYAPDMMLFISIIIIVVDFVLFLILNELIPKFFNRLPDTNLDLNFDAVANKLDSSISSSFHHPGILEAFFLFFSAGLIFGLITSIYSIYGYNILSINLSMIGLITGAGALIQTIWAPMVGKLYKIVKDEVMRLFAWSVLLIGTIVTALSTFGGTFFVLGYFIVNFGNASYFTMEITRMGRVVEPDEFSLVFGIATSLVILATAIAGFISPYFYNIVPEGTFFAAVMIALVSLCLVVIRYGYWKKLRKRMDENRDY